MRAAAMEAQAEAREQRTSRAKAPRPPAEVVSAEQPHSVTQQPVPTDIRTPKQEARSRKALAKAERQAAKQAARLTEAAEKREARERKALAKAAAKRRSRELKRLSKLAR